MARKKAAEVYEKGYVGDSDGTEGGEKLQRGKAEKASGDGLAADQREKYNSEMLMAE